VAAEMGKLEILHKLRELPKEVLTTQHLNDNCFLAKDNGEMTAWHMAKEQGNLDNLHKMWDWAKEPLTPKALRTVFFIVIENFGKNTLLLSADRYRNAVHNV
jgi:hypothetical protein